MTWKFSALLSGSENHKGYRITDDCGFWVADVSPLDEDGAGGKNNARLIAAAPELLEVCEQLAESAEYWSEYDVPLGIVDKLNAAIAKAKGEQP